MTPEIVLSSKKSIGEGHPCLIVAEIGQNHQGDVNLAEELISTAKDCGADVVKFQMTCLPEKFTKSALAREYGSCNSWGKTYGEHKQYLEFTKEQYHRLQMFAKDKDILFTASAMDVTSLDFLNSMNPPFIKIGSGDNTNYFLLEKALALNKPLVISTGMMGMKGVRSLYSKCAYKCQGVLLHCVSSYPAPFFDINLNVLDLYREEFPLFHYGYSGHEKGIAISLAAVTKGAKVLERHITLNKTWKGTDHSCSLEPNEFKDMVQGIRQIEESLGSKEKQFLECEIPCFGKLGKSLVAGTNIISGTELTLEHLKIKVSEPKGMNPTELFNVIGKRVIKNIEEDRPITDDCFPEVYQESPVTEMQTLLEGDITMNARSRLFRLFEIQ